MKKVSQQQKQYHMSARHQRHLKPNDVVGMQTDKGFQRLAVVKSTRDSPRSYIVTSDGADYGQNRRHLLPVNEPRPQNIQQDSYATGLQHPPIGDRALTTEGQKQQIVPLPSMATSPSLPSTRQQPSSPQHSHAPPCSLGCDQMSPTPGPTAVPCQAQPSRQLWASHQTKSKIL